MDEDKRPHDTSPPGEHPHSQDSRRDFIKTVVSAAAGLTLAAAAAGSEAHAAPAASGAAVVSTGAQNSLAHHLEAFRSALQSNDLGTVASYFAPNADYRSTQGLVRGSGEITASVDDALQLRGTADITSIKWISKETALVDGVFAAGKARGWFTEIWDSNSNGGKDFIIRASRIRVGPSDGAFNALSQLSPSTISDGVPDDVVQREEAEIRGHFKSFRAAFNGGDTKGVTSLLTRTADANPVFSFLDGRAQVMNGTVEMETKAANMTAPFNPGDGTGSGGERKVRGALYLAGEPKVLRFLSPTVVFVDGTAEISNIPLAHGFAPKEMKGVYSTLWTKTDTGWLCEAARPWF
jgi:hypothetical protein